MSASPFVIGWREWVGLPDLGVTIKAKVDTGARTSALHAEEIEVDGDVVHFTVLPVQRDDATVRVSAPLIDRRAVRPSSGEPVERLVVRTRARLHGRVWPIELTLARRDVMGFRMLLGRAAVRRRFLVDPGSSYTAGEPTTR